MSRAEDEVGDLLFAVANLARKLGVEPESALRRANDKFIRRFEAVERGVPAQGRSVRDATLEELEAEWQRMCKLQDEPTNRRPAKRLDPHLTAVAPHRDLTVGVGAEDRGAHRPQPVEHGRGRVPERVAAPAADQRDVRTPGVHERLRRGRAAAVVRHLQDAHARRRQARQNLALDVGAHVPQQQHRHVAVHDLEHHRIVVPHAAPLPIGRRRMQHPDA